MPKLITIWTFPYQHQMLIIRGRLESEGIETFAQDELTIQIDPLYSNALGGIKLMVYEEDAERATEILAETGYVKKADKQTEEFLQRLYSFTGRLPLLRNISFERRVFILVGVAVILVTAFLYLLAI